MVDKNIKKHLGKIIDNWANSVEDESIKKIIRTKTIITGGAIVSLFQNEEPKDYDIYLKDKESCKQLSQYYIDKWNAYEKEKSVQLQENEQTGRLKLFISSAGVASEDEEILEEPFEDVVEEIKEDDTKENYRPVFFSSNAVTLSNKIQFMVRFYGSVIDIHKTYDFLHCTSSYDPATKELHYTPECLRSIMDKQLIYRGSLYPVCSVIRTRKFVKRGWTCSAGQYLKMCYQISKLNLDDIRVLEDQLIGVDSAYFMALINALKNKKEKDPNFEINEPYVIALIDKIFGN